MIRTLFFIISFCIPLLGYSENKVKIPCEKIIKYYDRNSDGKTDKESHIIPCGADMDWSFFDEDFDGRYEKKIDYGIGAITSSIDIPVTKDVEFSK